MNRFTRLIALLLLILSAAARPAGAAAASQGEGEARGRLSLDTCTLDLGEIPGDSIAEATLRFRNTGDAPLQILSIFSDCGCTSTEYTSDPVGPDEEGGIRVRFNPKGRKAGPFRKVLRIRSTAGNAREHLTVKGSVVHRKEPVGLGARTGETGRAGSDKWSPRHPTG